MKVLIIGGAGMIGRKLAERLARDGELGGKADLGNWRCYDVVPAAVPAGAKMPVKVQTGDLPAAGEAAKLVAGKPEMIFHLAAIVSGEAEQEFDKGYRINMDGTRRLLEAVRARRPQAAAGVRQLDRGVRRAVPRGHRRRVLQHAADLLRHAEERSASCWSPTTAARASSTASACACPPSACVPASPTRRRRASSPTSCASRWRARRRCCRSPTASCTGTPRRAPPWSSCGMRRPSIRPRSVPRRALTMPGVAVTVGEQIAALRKVAGDKVVARIRREPDPFIEQIVAGWPRKFAAKRALELGFKPDAELRGHHSHPHRGRTRRPHRLRRVRV